MIQGHGGNIYVMARQLGCRPEEIVDMSSNINPLGMPPGLLDHLTGNLHRLAVLPEVDSRTAVDQMARFLGVEAGRVLAANGTTQFIYCACPSLNASKVMIVGPTYADYADACRMHHIEPRFFLADADRRFDIDAASLEKEIHGMDLVFVCNPNNPTGRLIPVDQLRQICMAHAGTRFVIDESYLPFAPDGPSQSMAAFELENVSVLWSFSKIFGAPGLRAGFLVANTGTIDRFKRYMQPWSLNSLAQAAIEFVDRNRDAVSIFVQKTRRFLEIERRSFHETIADGTAAEVYPARASYLLMQLPHGWRADHVCRRMAQKRILIRNCGNFHGLSDRYVRVALKDSQANRLAAGLLAEMLRQPGPME